MNDQEYILSDNEGRQWRTDTAFAYPLAEALGVRDPTLPYKPEKRGVRSKSNLDDKDGLSLEWKRFALSTLDDSGRPALQLFTPGKVIKRELLEKILHQSVPGDFVISGSGEVGPDCISIPAAYVLAYEM